MQIFGLALTHNYCLSGQVSPKTLRAHQDTACLVLFVFVHRFRTDLMLAGFYTDDRIVL